MDPLAEASRRFTPYHYGNNNPVRFTDPDGRHSMDNLTTYNPGSAVADFITRNGLGEKNMPLFYTDDSGIMIRSNALGDDGQGGGGGGSSPTFQFPKGTEEYYKKNYPAFYNLVKNILPNMSADSNLMKALSSASGFSIEELEKIFKYDEGAILRDGGSLPFGDAEYPYADLQDKSLINTINIDERVLGWFEKANKNPDSLEGVTNNFWMVMLIGHETSHWGDWTKRSVRFKDTSLVKDFGNEVGYFFEYNTLRSAYPNYPIKSGLHIGNYGSNISEIFKGFVKSNFKGLSNIFKQ